jgi:sterol desaturase/sphingolipid hydroxylase (fatty acid hydroxylase superfamily)
MTNTAEQLLLLISTPIYIIVIGIEILLSSIHNMQNYNVKNSFTNFYLMLLNGGLDFLLRGFYIGVFSYLYTYKIITWQYAFLYWIVLLIFEDFLYYWLHRFDHEVRFFWATHVTHHSSTIMNFTVGFRSSVFQPLYRFIYFLPLPILGFKPIDIIFIYSATQIWGIFVHTELIKKMGWLEHFLVTPSHHRVHHASNPKYLDKNMGMFLIIWDKMFGTFQEELNTNQYQPIQYGLTTNLNNPSPQKLIFHEWEQILEDIQQPNLSWFEKLHYVFGKPGYSHNGSRKTSEELRKEEDNKEIVHSDCKTSSATS